MLTAGQLKELLKDVPDDYLVYAEFTGVTGIEVDAYPQSLFSEQPGTVEILL
jgi:hypothetical protein